MNAARPRINRSVKVITSAFGSMLAIASFEHGFFEALQGNRPVAAPLIQAIGESIRWWRHGTEEAFTLIPNFLVTGIVVMLISVFAFIWSLRFISTRHGSSVFLLAFIALTLVGGGLGHLPFFVLTWAFSTRMRRPLVSSDVGRRVGRERTFAFLWKAPLVLGCALWLGAIEIAVFGFFPGIRDAETLLIVCWGMLLGALVMIAVSYLRGIAFDRVYPAARD
jgi:hypothetical protein